MNLLLPSLKEYKKYFLFKKSSSIADLDLLIFESSKQLV